MKTDKEKIELAFSELNQAAIELEEAAKIIHGSGLPKTASVFAEASQKKRQAAVQMLPDLTGP